jgi:DNA-binding NtrC family response regulator
MAHAASDAARVSVLVIERDAGVCDQVRQVLSLAGHSVRTATGVEEALRTSALADAEVVLVDVGIVGLPGLAALGAAPELRPHAQLVAALPAGAESRAVETMRAGAQGWLRRPYEGDALVTAVERAALQAARERELASLRSILGSRAEGILIGRSPAMQRLRELVWRAAGARGTVVVSGESGTGKELIARTIHALSDRAQRPCIVVQCGDRDAVSLEVELFGASSMGGSVAIPGERGALLDASGGTVVLDDAGALPPLLQARLVRVLQERALPRGRDGALVPADFRLLATVREQRTSAGAPTAPRYDLLARSGVFSVAVPPLRDRRSDIPLLAAHFRERFARETGATPPPVTPEVLASLLGHDWPGNVRQLEQYIGRLLLVPPGTRLPFDGASAPVPVPGGTGSVVEIARGSRWPLEQLERTYIQLVLREEGGHQSRAAAALGIDRRTLYRKLKQYRAEEATARRQLQQAPRMSA